MSKLMFKSRESKEQFSRKLIQVNGKRMDGITSYQDAELIFRNYCIQNSITVRELDGKTLRIGNGMKSVAGAYKWTRPCTRIELKFGNGKIIDWKIYKVLVGTGGKQVECTVCDGYDINANFIQSFIGGRA